MKRTLCMLLLSLLCLGALAAGCQSARTSATPTPAPTATPAVVPSPSESPAASPDTAKEAVAITAAEPYTGDLDGDGAEETVTIVETAATETEEAAVALIVTPAQGEAALFEYGAGFNFLNSAYVADLRPGDGVYEILLSIDVDSDDDLLYIFRYADGQLTRVLDRGGDIASVEGDVLTINERVDVFGTWSADIAYALDAADQLVAQPDQLFVPSFAMGPVKAGKDLAIERKGDDGRWSAATLAKGEEITVTATDKLEYVYFTVADGGEGRIRVTFTEYGTPLIDGEYDTDCFEDLPYAD